MKLFLAVVLLAATVTASSKEYHKLKKWAMHKACESCVGEEGTRAFMIKIKTAAAKCMRIDAPELDLPMYKYPYRAVGALVDGAFSAHHHNSDGHHNRPHVHRPGSDHGHHHGGGGMMGGGGGGGQGEDYLDQMLKRVLFRKFVAKVIEDEFLDEDDDDEDPLGPTSSSGMRGAMKFFKRGRYQPRQKRQSSDKKDMFELGDRLNDKLQNAKQRKEEEIGNCTCVMREVGLIDSSNNLNSADQIIRSFRDIPLNGDDSDGWLRNKLEEGVRLCHEYASAVPQSVLEKCPYGPELAKVKMYKKCCKMNKFRTCRNYDIKKQLELNFGGSLKDLVETTQMDEEELLPLVMTLLHGPEMDY